ncbi:MAG TPA: hypothetical protein VIN10_07505 [Bacteroidales bacterium]
MKISKHFYTLLIAGFLSVFLMFSKSSQAQTYYGYQSIGKQTFLFSLVWQGELKIGFGYIYRIFGSKTFNDLQLEMRFPLKTIYRFNEYEGIAGLYKPLSYSRGFVGVGGHFKWNSELKDGQRVQKLSLAMTAIPSYVYAASTTDGVYGTIGLQLTYAPVIFATSQSGESKANWDFFPQHRFEGGLHFDMLTGRTAGIAINTVTSYYLNSKETFLQEEKPWQVEGIFYFGTTYALNRD